MPPAATACGFVLFRDRGTGPEYLLLVNRRRGEPGLPKGHAEDGETPVITALRETAEETGLTDLAVDTFFRRTLRYPAERRGVFYDKTVVYFLARLRSGEVRLSVEHSAYRWAPLGEALEAIPFPNLRGVLWDAGLFLKDPALFALAPAAEAEADEHLRTLPHADDTLVAHLRGGSRLARGFAEALAFAGKPVHVEATAVGALLHDVGRAIGRHEDHQRAGLEHLRESPFAPYGFACVSHFTKGATDEELLAAGVPSPTVAEFRRLIDGSSLTWEERCVALADACMMGGRAVMPTQRFADLRLRYDARALIDLQARRTEGLRAELAAAIGRDPLQILRGRGGKGLP